MNMGYHQENLFENYRSPISSCGKILSLDQNKNEESTFYQDESRFSYYEGNYNVGVDESALSPRSNQQSFRDDTPVFAFPEYRDYQSSILYHMMDSHTPNSILAEDDNDSELLSSPPSKVVESIENTQSLKACISPQSSCDTAFTAEPRPKESAKHNDMIDEIIDNLTKTPHFKDHRFSTRRDVVNKTIFRIMKRFYLMLFKEENPKLKLKFSSVDDYLEGAESLLSTLNTNLASNQKLKYYIVQLVSSKFSSQFNIDEEIASGLKLLDTCLYSYSDKAINRIYEDLPSRLLFSYFYQQGQEFFFEQKNVKKNFQDYMSAFECLYISFNKA